MSVSLNYRLQEIVKIDEQLAAERRDAVVCIDMIKDLKRQRREHIIALQTAPRGNTRA